ncbi:hypothetical protein KKF61_03330 [Patescibacteria group bacterium]|nr:hypothetical protein [Patescibacteria group bacterium]MBU0963997.1 hypothetical protein [Patescibacteria group bacterium]
MEPKKSNDFLGKGHADDRWSGMIKIVTQNLKSAMARGELAEWLKAAVC